MTALNAKLPHLPKILMTSRQLTYSIFTSTYIELHHTKSRFSTSLHSITDISKLHCTTGFQISQAVDNPPTIPTTNTPLDSLRMASNDTIYASIEDHSFDDATHVDDHERVDTPNDQTLTGDESNDTAASPDRPVQSLRPVHSLNLRVASSEDFQRLLTAYEMMMEAISLVTEVRLRGVMRRICDRENTSPVPSEEKMIYRCHEQALKRFVAAYDRIAEQTKQHANTRGGPSAGSNGESAAQPVDLSERSIEDLGETLAAEDMVAAIPMMAIPGSDPCANGIDLRKLHIVLAVERLRRASSKQVKYEERWVTKSATDGFEIHIKSASSDGRQ